jgi:hypothetical protein
MNLGDKAAGDRNGGSSMKWLKLGQVLCQTLLHLPHTNPEALRPEVACQWSPNQKG